MSDDAFPAHDPVGPASDPLADAGRRVLLDVVAPGATDADAHGVRRSTIDALAAAGLVAGNLSAADQREATELLAGSDASTWFCWVQHATPTRTLAGQVPGRVEPGAAELRDRLLPDLRAGHRLAAVAFAHLRRPGPPNPVARRVAGGWVLDGSLDWVTSWDIADVVLVMAATADREHVVCAYLPAGLGPRTTGLAAGEPLRLLAMGGTHTRPLRLDAVHVADAQVGGVLDAVAWQADDARRSADANPAAFGIARGSIAELDAVARARGDAAVAATVDALVAQCRALRTAAYDLADVDGPVAERLALRAASLHLATRASQAVVVARAGAAMRMGQPAERRVREAAFLLVQAQTAAGRAQSLALLADAPVATGQAT